MKKNYISPYSAAITGGGFLFEETDILLPLLQSEDSENLLKDEAVNNRLLLINAEKSRTRNIHEIERRYKTMSRSFWKDYEQMEEADRRVALFFVILKTYKILFDFHVQVTMRRWNSISKSVTFEDIMLEFNELSARDKFVDSWSEATKKRVASAYLTMLRKVGILTAEDSLKPLASQNFGYYLSLGEPWFLEACLLQPYQIDIIKKSMS